jgi:hypothetical protein
MTNNDQEQGANVGRYKLQRQFGEVISQRKVPQRKNKEAE